MKRFDVIKKLSDGVFAEMVLAQPEGSSDRVVLEMLRPELSADLAFAGRFAAEAKHRRGLVHPRFPRRVSGGKTPDGRLFVASEPINCDDLGTVLAQRGTLEVEEVVGVIEPLCEALSYLHERGLTHGYLKPANIYLPGGLGAFQPKLLDFGLAFFRGGRPTPAGRILIEPEYLSPERLSGTRGDSRSDVYGLGVLMYQLLTGRPPFRAEDSAETRRLQLRTRPAALTGSSARLQGVIDECLAKSPADRFHNVEELRVALTALVRAEDDPTHALPEVTVEAPLAEKLDDVLGNYRLEKLLGEGAMGRVYQARHVRLGRQVALKVMRPELALSRTFIQRFFQEARSVNQINHEHIVEIFDFCEEPIAGAGTRVFCVMELLEGENLSDRLRRAPLNVVGLAKVARQICSALEAAHKVGVVHRDVKPDNIFLIEKSGAQYVKVLDFGVAKLLPGSSEAPTEKTLEGVVIGTPSYMAPEQAEGQSDHRTDIYALGVVLYKALSGRAPFEGRSYADLMVRVIRDPAPPLPKATPAGDPIPPGLRALVRRCLAKNPLERPQSMAELSEKLAVYAKEAKAAPSSSRSAKQWAVGGLGLGAMVFCAWVALRPAVVKGVGARAPFAVAGPIHVLVRSSPSGAEVRRLDQNVVLGQTPLALELPREVGHLAVRIELAGYQPTDRELSLSADSQLEAALEPKPSEEKVKRAPPRRSPDRTNARAHRDDVLDPFGR